MRHRNTLFSRTAITFICVIFMQMATAEEADNSWDQVFSFQKRLAQQGNVKAQFILGEMYEKGRGVKRDPDTAILWYRKAEKNGNKKAAARISALRDAMRRDAQMKSRKATEKKRLAEEKARQRALEKQQAEQAAKARERKKQQAEAAARQKQQQASTNTKPAASNNSKVVSSKQNTVAKPTVQDDDSGLSPAERARRIKEAEQRAQEVVRQNALRQQQKAEAALQKYRAAMIRSKQQSEAMKNPSRYQDPFE